MDYKNSNGVWKLKRFSELCLETGGSCTIKLCYPKAKVIPRADNILKTLK